MNESFMEIDVGDDRLSLFFSSLLSPSTIVFDGESWRFFNGDPPLVGENDTLYKAVVLRLFGLLSIFIGDKSP